MILSLLGSPRLSSKYPDTTVRQYIAFSATVLWALHPIQTQAVTYIVQRMTILAAMFSIIGIYVYLKARLNQGKMKWLSYLSILVIYLLAFGSKENAILLLGSLLLIEFIFLQKISTENAYNNRLIYLTFGLLIGVAGYLVLSLFHFDISSLFHGYESRFFSLTERLLTEPRILVFYLSQIFYPVTDRFSIEHDIVISTSLFQPWTTFGAISLIAALLLFSVFCFKKYPILAFSIIFFFYNHIIESTIFPLELVFEHRNYLPSFFLFFPFMAGIKNITSRFAQSKQPGSYFIPISLVFLLVVLILSLGTYTRNLAWLTEKSLMTDAIDKAPNKSRPYHGLASYLLRKEQAIDEALFFYNLSLQKQGERKSDNRYQTLLEISKIYVIFKNDYKSAIQFYKQAIEVKPETLVPRMDLAISLIATGQLDDALEQIDIMLAKRGVDYKLQKHETITRAYLLNLQALIFLKQNKTDMALNACREALQYESEQKITLPNLGFALSKTKEYIKAENYLQKSLSLEPSKNLFIYFLLLENSINADYFEKTNEYSTYIIENFPLKSVFSTLKLLEGDSVFQPVDPYLLRQAIMKQLNIIGNTVN